MSFTQINIWILSSLCEWMLVYYNILIQFDRSLSVIHVPDTFDTYDDILDYKDYFDVYAHTHTCSDTFPQDVQCSSWEMSIKLHNTVHFSFKHACLMVNLFMGKILFFLLKKRLQTHFLEDEIKEEKILNSIRFRIWIANDINWYEWEWNGI